jgi:hypothetical protein
MKVWEPLFYTIYMSYFSHKCRKHVLISTVREYISPSALIRPTVKTSSETREQIELSCEKVNSCLFGRPCDACAIAD